MAKTRVLADVPDDGGLPPTSEVVTNPQAQPETSSPASTPAARPEPPDPFDPSALRLGADYAESLGIRKVIHMVLNRKPHRSEWFMVRAGAEWQLQTAVLEVEKGVERSTFLSRRRSGRTCQAKPHMPCFYRA